MVGRGNGSKAPWRVASRLLAPRRQDYSDQSSRSAPGNPDRGYGTIGRLYLARTALGYLLWVGLRLAGATTAPQDLKGSDIIWALAPFWLAPIAVILVSILLIRVQLPGLRSRTRTQLMVPITCAVFGFIGWAGTAWVGANRDKLPDFTKNNTEDSARSVPEAVIGLALLAIVLWISVFYVWGIILGAFYNYRSIDGHPYLGAVSTLLTAWIVVVLGYIHPLSAKISVREDAPWIVQQGSTWAGPVIFTLLACYELFYLHSIGLRWRGAAPAPIGGPANP